MIRMEFKKQFKILNRIYGIAFMFRSRKFKGDEVYGFANNTADGKYVIFLDYDHKDLNSIKFLMRDIQDSFTLSNIYIFETANGYHCICFDKVNIDQYLAILNISHCCEKFRKTPLLFGHNQWTLRLSEKDGEKPKFIYRLTSKHSILEKSSAHISIVDNLYDLQINKCHNDGSTKIIGCKYPV